MRGRKRHRKKAAKKRQAALIKMLCNWETPPEGAFIGPLHMPPAFYECLFGKPDPC